MSHQVERDAQGNKLPHRTRRERFLDEMDAVIPWARLIALIEPHYPKAGRGRRPQPLETMLRIHFLQHFFDLSDPAAQDALHDSASMARFVRLRPNFSVVPDESTILRFRHLLEREGLSKTIFDSINAHLAERSLTLRTGTIADATLIAAAPSTKNKDKARDPEMRQTKKGKQWHFGMKLHVGTDLAGLVHTVLATDAAQSDIGQLDQLLHGDEEVVYADQAYWSAFHRECAKGAGGALPGQPPGGPGQEAHRAREAAQPAVLDPPGARGARLRSAQAPVGVQEGALPRDRQEPVAGARRVRAGEPVPGTRCARCGGVAGACVRSGRAHRRPGAYESVRTGPIRSSAARQGGARRCGGTRLMQAWCRSDFP